MTVVDVNVAGRPQVVGKMAMWLSDALT